MVVFRPNDPNNLLQVTPQFHVQAPEVPRIKGQRFPAPGSQPLASIPSRPDSDLLYNNSNYPRDPRNLPNKVNIQIP